MFLSALPLLCIQAALGRSVILFLLCPPTQVELHLDEFETAAPNNEEDFTLYMAILAPGS